MRLKTGSWLSVLVGWNVQTRPGSQQLKWILSEEIWPKKKHPPEDRRGVTRSTEGSLLPSRRISESWSSWRTRGWGQCVTVWVFFRSVLQTQLRSHWLCFPNTRKESGMLFMSVPPHQGDEWVLLISCVRGWHLLFPLAASRLQLSFHRFQEDGERKGKTARNNEAWDQLAQQEFGLFPRRRDCVSLTQVTVGCWTGPERKKRLKTEIIKAVVRRGLFC